MIAVIVCVLGGLFFLLRPGARDAGPQERTFEVSIADGEMSPEEISAREGGRVTIRIESDEPIELHVHGYDVEREVGPGEPGWLSFEANLTGRFESENLVLMVFYTVSSLWILAQPIVE